MEARLEGWIRDDIGLVNDDLLVIGQQVRTTYGGIIDLLAVDAAANLVILELKRDRTPREVVAQALDYASWVQNLTPEVVQKLASDFFGADKTFEQAFTDKFDDALPEIINGRHRIYIVASSLNPSTERIIEYLSEIHGIDINAATFAYFKAPDGSEMVGRSMLLNEDVVETRAVTGGVKRWRAATEEELLGIAVQNGVEDLWKKAYQEFDSTSERRLRRKDSLLFRVRIDGPMKWFIKMYPGSSSHEHGLAISLHLDHISRYFNLSPEQLSEVCTEAVNGLWSTYFFDADRLDRLIALLRENAPQG